MMGVVNYKKISYEYYNRKLILLTIYDQNGIIKNEEKYDYNGNPISSKSFENDKMIFSSTFEYYNNSLPKSEIYFDYKNNKNSSIEYKYEYYD